MLTKPPFILILSIMSIFGTVSIFNRGIMLPGSQQEYNAPQGDNSIEFLMNDTLVIENQFVQSQVYVTEQASIISLWFGERYQNHVSFLLNDKIALRTYSLDQPLSQFANFRTAQNICQFSTDELYGGELTITRYSEDSQLLSGIFKFSAGALNCDEHIKITKGRFDLRFSQNSL